jgi:hypothetical protein
MHSIFKPRSIVDKPHVSSLRGVKIDYFFSCKDAKKWGFHNAGKERSQR